VRDADEIAHDAGLLHLGDDRPGIRRRRRGRGFSYERTGGDRRPIGAATRERIDALVILPAWRDVWIAPEADAHLQATGVDAAGRKQYRYHDAWTEAAALDKFEHLAVVGARLPRVRRRVAADLAGGDADVAAVVRLIDRGLIRPGSDSATEAAGATTLAPDTIAVRRDRVVLDFVGKSAVEQHVEIDDADLADALRAILRRSSSDDECLFADCVERAVRAPHVNDYLAEASGAEITAKDLRTWGATAADVEVLCTAGDDADGTAMYEQVAELLGNTPAVCRSSYVAPCVVDAHESGQLAPLWRRSRTSTWMTRAERTLTKFLT